MVSEKVFLNWLITHLKQRLQKEYSSVLVNYDGENQHDFEGYYPNLILSNYGMVVAVVNILTEGTISASEAKTWKAMSTLGVKFILMVPHTSKKKVTELLWNEMIAQDVAVGTYELKINMP